MSGGDRRLVRRRRDPAPREPPRLEHTRRTVALACHGVELRLDIATEPLDLAFLHGCRGAGTLEARGRKRRCRRPRRRLRCSGERRRCSGGCRGRPLQLRALGAASRGRRASGLPSRSAAYRDDRDHRPAGNGQQRHQEDKRRAPVFIAARGRPSIGRGDELDPRTFVELVPVARHHARPLALRRPDGGARTLSADDVSLLRVGRRRHRSDGSLRDGGDRGPHGCGRTRRSGECWRGRLRRCALGRTRGRVRGSRGMLWSRRDNPRRRCRVGRGRSWSRDFGRRRFVGPGAGGAEGERCNHHHRCTDGHSKPPRAWALRHDSQRPGDV